MNNEGAGIALIICFLVIPILAKIAEFIFNLLTKK
jgi:hypothetical protein